MNIQGGLSDRKQESDEAADQLGELAKFGSKTGSPSQSHHVASSVFEDGNFSAKYIPQDTATSLNTESIEAAANNEFSNPVTIEGGFRELHPVTTPVSSTLQRPRRASMLSNLMAKSQEDRPRSPALSTEAPDPQTVEIVERHLNTSPPTLDAASPAGTHYESLKRQGGDITRDIYNWVSGHKSFGSPLRRVASSGSLQSSTMSSEMRMPGGFRRDFIVHGNSEAEADRASDVELGSVRSRQARPNFLAQNFIEFLSLYGHFAGENLEEEETGDEYDLDQADASDVSEASDLEEDEVLDDTEMLASTVIPAKKHHPGRRARSSNISIGDQKRNRTTARRKPAFKPRTRRDYSDKKTTNQKAFLLLLKAFVGTGVVFLPKSFSNGGLLFCNLMIVAFSVISYYCFLILIRCTERVRVSGYGDVGLKVVGRNLQLLILGSLALSQLGFSSSYVVFVAENFKVVANSVLATDHGVGFFVAIQLLIFLPLSLTRNISKLSFTALIADAFILLGLVYIYFCSTAHLVLNGVSPKVSMFKSDTWSLFMGTAVFAYEGIGLIIPIRESMAHPDQFERLLVLVMAVVTVIFVTLSTISYLSFGDDVKTVILLNFPQTTLALVVQVCYAIAILLSTPLQLFPAIKIFENYLFHKERATWKRKIRKDSEQKMRTESQPLLLGVPSYDSTSRDLRQLIQSMPEDAVDDNGVMSGKRDFTIKWLKNFARVCVVFLMCTIGYLGSSDLDRFVSIIGSFTCIPLIYVYPPVLYLKSFDELSRPARLANLVICVIGVGMMAYTSYQTLSTWGE
ncbi:hypothetical protein OGAPHI_002404 [Ogataea philodendri]|uniref:Amino acid transporter transmembrane domain-containing protein n=1 Tax=Ogataea philodendri TaxID=1378263 RepID=A0A9P8PBS0_9ASCO|nr:uncharacterized protein OGAPHI_002404 [Ogataea philodendri]KAH3668650.1 hypothetical protein OGAPHI_002404 [Ogataea philodendri]